MTDLTYSAWWIVAVMMDYNSIVSPKILHYVCEERPMKKKLFKKIGNNVEYEDQQHRGEATTKHQKNGV